MLENQAMIDKLLGGRYRIVTTLGSGGFSQTYVAEDTHRPGHPKCAVKHLQPANNNQSFLQSARRLFQSEAESLEKLGHHERIPRLLAYFEENQEFYLVQEFIQGQLLTDKLQPNQCWTENQVWEFIQEILEILVFIHSQGFIHRDIKPNNIIQRQQDNKLVLVDFGAVKQNWTQLLSQTSKIEMPATVGIGTPGYMPMEQARGRPRPNSDIYALGAIALQALTGLYPMQLEEDFETGELLWQQSAQVSDALARIITKMVRYHFKDRYETATEALAEVQQLAPLYLPTKINLNLASPDVSQVTQQNQLTQNLSPTAITTPVFPSPAKANLNSLALTPTVAVPSTTIVAPPKLKQRHSSTQRRRPYYLTIGATIGAALVAVGAGYATYWQPRLKFEQTLEQVEKLKATGKYSECIVQAATIPQNSSLYSDAQNVLHDCKLTEAKRLATNADFSAAIALVNSLPKDSPAYGQAKPLIAQWYNSILALATGKYQAGKLNEAIAIAQDIPSTSLVYQKAQAAIKQWQASTAKNSFYSAATVKLAPTKTTPTTTVATKSIPSKKVVKSSPPVDKKAIAVSKPRSYTSYQKKTTASSKPRTVARPSIPTRRITQTSSKTVARPSIPTRRITRTSSRIVARTSVPTRRIVQSKRRLPISRMATSKVSRTVTRTSSTKKYLRISKKVATTNQVKSRTRTVVKRVNTRAKRSNRQRSYRWTTKSVR